VCLLVAAGAAAGQAELECCHRSLPARLGPAQLHTKQRGSGEPGERPAAALGSVGVAVAMLSRAAASPRGAGAGLGGESQVWGA